jgi:glycosyltransferase involved in cell wall biosynthesis
MEDCTYNIAILITCHNRKEKTLCCLRNLFACPLPRSYKLYVYLVDDGSTDGTAKGIKDNFPAVKIIQGDGNLFWNRGMNLAWKTAVKERDYDFYLWLNDDVSLYSNSLIELLETSQIKNNESIICGATCAIDNKNQITYSGKKLATRYNFVRLPPNGEIQECEQFCGNIVLISKYVFRKIGFNDIYFRHGLGDFDYALKAKRIGLKSFISPNVLGECDGHYDYTSEIKKAGLKSFLSPNALVEHGVYYTLPIYLNSKCSIYSRWKSLHSPRTPHPKEMFYFNRICFGLLFAIYKYISSYIWTLFPKLWELWIRIK